MRRTKPSMKLICLSGLVKGKKFDFGQTLNIGSDSSNEICIDGIAEKHAKIVGLDLINISDVHKVYVNGVDIRKKKLSEGDVLVIGANTFKVSSGRNMKKKNISVNMLYFITITAILLLITQAFLYFFFHVGQISIAERTWLRKYNLSFEHYDEGKIPNWDISCLKPLTISLRKSRANKGNILTIVNQQKSVIEFSLRNSSVISLEKNKNYKVTVFFRGEGKAQLGLEVHYIKDNKSVLRSFSYFRSIADNWKKASLDITPKRAKNIKLIIRGKGCFEHIDIDNIKLVPVSQESITSFSYTATPFEFDIDKNGSCSVFLNKTPFIDRAQIEVFTPDNDTLSQMYTLATKQSRGISALKLTSKIPMYKKLQNMHLKQTMAFTPKKLQIFYTLSFSRTPLLRAINYSFRLPGYDKKKGITLIQKGQKIKLFRTFAELGVTEVIIPVKKKSISLILEKEMICKLWKKDDDFWISCMSLFPRPKQQHTFLFTFSRYSRATTRYIKKQIEKIKQNKKFPIKAMHIYKQIEERYPYHFLHSQAQDMKRGALAEVQLQLTRTISNLRRGNSLQIYNDFSHIFEDLDLLQLVNFEIWLLYWKSYSTAQKRIILRSTFIWIKEQLKNKRFEIAHALCEFFYFTVEKPLYKKKIKSALRHVTQLKARSSQ